MGSMMNQKEGENEKQEMDTNSMMQMHQDFLSGIQQIVDSLNAKKMSL
jgi:hypothetical protein